MIISTHPYVSEFFCWLQARNTYLGNKTLEESAHALVPRHLGQDLHARLGVLKVLVLHPRLDDIKRRGHKQRRRRTRNRRDKVLEPRRLVVVLQLEQVLLGERRATEQRERTRRIAGRCPSPAPVQAKALVCNNLHHATAAEGLRVCLALDLEHVEGQEDDLSYADQGAGSRVQDGLAGLLTKGILKVGSVVLRQVVARDGLTAVLVYSLENLLRERVERSVY